MVVEERHIFVSYSSKDRRFVARLCSALKGTGFRIWLDQFEIKAGDSLQGKIEAAIADAAYVVAVLSPNSIASKWVTDELRSSMAIQRDEDRRFVVPILHADCQLPLFLRDRRYVDFRRPRRFDLAVKELLSALDLQAPSAGPSQERPKRDDPRIFDEVLQSVAASKGTTGTEDDGWIEHIRSLPLTHLLNKSLSCRSFGGDNQTELLLHLALTSHSVISNEFNALVLLLCFKTDVEANKITDEQLFRFILRAIEERSITTTCRSWFLDLFVTRVTAVFGERPGVVTMPDLFRRERADRLADDLIEKFLSADEAKTKSGLGALWALGSRGYRSGIVRYVLSKSKWKDSTQPPSTGVAESADPNVPHQAFRKRWDGLLSPEEILPEPEHAQETLKRAMAGEHLGLSTVVDSIETLARSQPPEVADHIIVPFLIRAPGELLKHYPPYLVLETLKSVLASPYLDPVCSLFALHSIMRHFGFSSVAFDDRFPICFLTPKDFGGRRQSMIDGLVEVIATDDSEKDLCLLILTEMLDTFRQEAIRYAVAAAIESHKEPESNVLLAALAV